MRLSIVAALVLPAAAPLAAQRPADWRVRFDRAGVADTSMKIDQMGPGWHFYTTGRGSGIAWRPSQTATGNFKVESETFMFPGTGHADGYGLLLGGRDLDGPNQTYLYFLVRRDGQFLIKHRAGTAVHDVVPWTANAAIARQEGEANVRNILAVEAGADSVAFLVNNQRVHALPRSAAAVDGIVGLRVNHGLSVHVSRVGIQQR